MPNSTTNDLRPADDLVRAGADAPPRSVRPVDGGAALGLGTGVALPEGTIASLADETDVPRRSRLLAAAVFLAATFGLLTAWAFASDNAGTFVGPGSRFSTRCALTRAAMLARRGRRRAAGQRIAAGTPALRGVEWVLFLGLTLILMVSQYLVGLELANRGPDFMPIVLAFLKDGTIQMLVLIMIYGSLIPNPPAVAARTLLAMFLGPVAVMLLLGSHSQVGAVVERLGYAAGAGSNILLLAVGTAVAAYGSFLINSLLVQLNQAQKFGQYRLVRKLGEGGMGEVHLAEHQLLKRPCALKLIKREAGADPIALARFEREVQSAARLSHPNTIEIYDYGHADDGTFYYVMEYLKGMSLTELVHRAGPLPPGRMIYLFRQVCAGLAEAHAQGLVHRDLKPANVFIAVRGGDSDVAKVLDFGLVKITRDDGSTTLSGGMTISGTPRTWHPNRRLPTARSMPARTSTRWVPSCISP